MKINTKIINVLAAGMLSVVILSGCSNEEPVPAETSTAQSVPDETAAPTPEPAVSSGTATEDPMDSIDKDEMTIELFCGITEAEGKVTPEDVELAKQIAEKLAASEDEFTASLAPNFEIDATNFQFALDYTDGQLPPDELETVSKSCDAAL